MIFTVYRVTNLANGKFYVGVHKTSDPNDTYMGSGRAIKAAIKKHGRQNFRKEVMFVFETSLEAYAKEVELTADFAQVSNYNMRRGGVGGFTRENALKGANSVPKEASKRGGRRAHQLRLGFHSFTTEQLSESGRKGGAAHKGRVKSPEHREKLRQSLLGRPRPMEVRLKISEARKRSRKVETGCS